MEIFLVRTRRRFLIAFVHFVSFPLFSGRKAILGNVFRSSSMGLRKSVMMGRKGNFLTLVVGD